MEARDSWRRLPDDKRVIYGLMGANIAVHLLWKLPSLSRFMLSNFVQVHAMSTLLNQRAIRHSGHVCCHTSMIMNTCVYMVLLALILLERLAANVMFSH